MLCKNCGFELDDDVTACTNCGAPTDTGVVDEAVQDDQQEATLQAEPPDQAELEDEQPVQQPAPATTTYTTRDLRWTFRQTLVGKTANVLVVDVVISLVFAIVYAIISKVSVNVPSLLGNLADTSASFLSGGLMGSLFTLAISLFLPILLMLIFLLPSAFFVKVFLNIKARRTTPTKAAVVAHRKDTRFKWRLVYGFFLGFIDAFTISGFAYYAFTGFLMNHAENLSKHFNVVYLISTVIFVFALGVAEIRMRRLNRMFCSDKGKNEDLIKGLASGSLISEVPDEYADELGVARIARLLDIGAAHSIKGAVRLIKIVELKDKISNVSSFIGSWVSALANTCSLGLLDIMDASLDDVTTRIARGQDIEHIDVSTKKKKPILEIFCFIVYIVIVGLYFKSGLR